MKMFSSVFLLFITVSVSVGEEIHEHHDGAYENILRTLKLNNSLDLQSVTAIVERLGIHDCSNKTSQHHKCVKPESLFGFFNISTNSSVEETDFAKMATVIVYSLLPMEHHDDDNVNESDEHDELFLTEKVDIFGELLERYKTSALCEQILDQVLRDVNESVGQQLNTKKCFSSHEILHELNISTGADITRENLPDISAIIVSKLLDGHCIEVEHETPLPCPSFFVEDLFRKYAENNVIGEEKFEELLKDLRIGKPGTNDENQNTEDDHDGHDHRRRRRRHVSTGRYSRSLSDDAFFSAAQEEQTGRRRYRREAEHHGHDHDAKNRPKYEKCYSVNEIFAIYNMDKKSGVNVKKFQSLTSSLLHQVATNACVVEAHDKHSKKKDVEDTKIWGYGVLAVVVISICSMIGVTVVPVMDTLLYRKVVVFLISLAVGTLVGDALLHLLPHAAGLHGSHDHAGDSMSSHEKEGKSYLWKFLIAVAGIYSFFIFETITHHLFGKSIGHSHSVENPRGHNQFANGGNKPGQTEEGVEAHKTNGDQSVVMVNMASLNEDKSRVGGMPDVENADNIGIEEKGVKKRIASVAWMIIIGDTIHNFADGIAIGVAFSDSITGGVSTAIAVFCHELPHELGDFAVLLSAGMHVKEALLANFLSSLSCFAGLIFGILIGHIEDVNLWIFAATAGFFLYVALTDMLPELMHSSESTAISKKTIFLLQNAGMLLGFGITILLAYYEDEIRV